MRKLLESPRRRRRLFWTAGVLAVAGLAGGLIAVIPNSTPGSAAPTRNEGPAQAVTQTNVHLSRADRHAIDVLLAKFVPAAVDRRSAAQAWALAGPELKASSTLAQWKAGTSPVPSYPAAEKQVFSGWPTVDVEKNQVTLSLLLHPRPGAKLADYTFSVQVIRQHGRWLVNRFYTIAINNPVRNGQREGRSRRLPGAQHGRRSAGRPAEAGPLVAPARHRNPVAGAADSARPRADGVRPLTAEAPPAGRRSEKRPAAAAVGLPLRLSTRGLATALRVA